MLAVMNPVARPVRLVGGMRHSVAGVTCSLPGAHCRMAIVQHMAGVPSKPLVTEAIL